MAQFDIYAREYGKKEWKHIILAESIDQANTIEDTWIYRGYETKIVNKLTGRQIR